MVVKRIDYNWFYSLECGEEFQSYIVGENRWHYDVRFEDGRGERIFNINKVHYE